MLSTHENTFTKMLQIMDELERVAAELDAPPELIRDLPAIVGIYWDRQCQPVRMQ